MKTMKIYNSSAAVPSDLQSGGAEGAHLQCAVDCKSTNSMPADCKSTGTFGATIRKAATVLCTLCSVLLISSCTQDELTPEYNDAPLTISANIPGDVWAVATRANEGAAAESFSGWTMHYTDYTGAAKTFAPGDGNVTMNGNSVSFSTIDNSTAERKQVVWAQVKASEPMHLTAVSDNGTPAVTDDDYTLHTSVASATAGQTLAFTEAMKPTLAKLTVNFTLTHKMTSDPSYADFSILFDAKQQGDSYDPMSHGGAWPVGDEDAIDGQIFLENSAGDGTYTVTATMLLPEQTMGETLTVTYGTSNSWMLKLSTVAVTGGEEGQKANQLIAGQHLTLNLSASILSVGTPEDIQIEAFTAADANSYENELDGTANKSNE